MKYPRKLPTVVALLALLFVGSAFADTPNAPAGVTNETKQLMRLWAKVRDKGRGAGPKTLRRYRRARLRALGGRARALKAIPTGNLERSQRRRLAMKKRQLKRQRERLERSIKGTGRPGRPRYVCRSDPRSFVFCLREIDLVRSALQLPSFDDSRVIAMFAELEAIQSQLGSDGNVLFSCGNSVWGAFGANMAPDWTPEMPKKLGPPTLLQGRFDRLTMQNAPGQPTPTDMMAIGFVCAADRQRRAGWGSSLIPGLIGQRIGPARAVGQDLRGGKREPSACAKKGIAEVDKSVSECQGSASGPVQAEGGAEQTAPATPDLEEAAKEAAEKLAKKQAADLDQKMRKVAAEVDGQESDDVTEDVLAAVATAVKAVLTEAVDPEEGADPAAGETVDTFFSVGSDDIVKVVDFVGSLDCEGSTCRSCDDLKRAWEFQKFMCEGEWDRPGSFCNLLTGCSGCVDPTVAQSAFGKRQCGAQLSAAEQEAVEQWMCENRPGPTDVETAVPFGMPRGCRTTAKKIEPVNLEEAIDAIRCGPAGYSLDCGHSEPPDVGQGRRPAGGKPPGPKLRRWDLGLPRGSTTVLTLDRSSLVVATTLEIDREFFRVR